MATLIQNGNIITGDGKTILPNSSLLFENGIITEIINQSHPPYSYADQVIDASNGYIIPGIINHHAHGITTGPFCPLGSEKLSLKRVLYNLDRHLMNGTTTILNVDGYTTISELDLINKMHPIKIKTATQHSSCNFKHANIGDGLGIGDSHLRTKLEKMIKLGSPAIGEVFALGPHYNIKRIEKEIGVEISVKTMGSIKEAVLGREIDLENMDMEKLHNILVESNLSSHLNDTQMKNLVLKYIYEPWILGYDALLESIEYSKKFDIPVIVHNSIDNWNKVVEASKILGNKLISSHSSYTFTPDEAVKIAKEIKGNGSIIDIFTGDYFGARQMMESLESTFALIREGLVDIISTDYVAGHWDPILRVLEEAINERIISVEKAISLATGNVIKAIPLLAPSSGLIEVGRDADILIVDKNMMSIVKYVIINGNVVVDSGKRIYRKI